MSRRSQLLLVIGALAVALLAILLGGDRLGLFGRTAGSDEQSDERGPLGPVALAGDTANGTTDTDATAADEPLVEEGAEADDRIAVEVPVAAPKDAPPVIRGQVIDRYGAPVEGADLIWIPGSGAAQVPSQQLLSGDDLYTYDSDFHEIGTMSTSALGMNTVKGVGDLAKFGTRVAEAAATTDVTGWFEIEGSDARRGGQLVVAPDLFVGVEWTYPVDVQGRDHFIQLPARGSDAPRLVVRLTSAVDGALLYPDHVELTLEALAAIPEGEHPESLLVGGSFRNEVHPADVVRSPGLLTVDRLSPGRWRLDLHASNSAFTTVLVEIPFEGEDVELDIALATFDGRWLGAPFEGEGVEALAPDTANGFAALPGDVEKWRPLGERRPDLHFVHTIRGFGRGPVSAAVLEIELEAASGMALNDGICLEYLGEDGFAWGSRISLLAAGGKWPTGARQTFYIDLGSLEPRGDSPPLLELLEDGALDVYVQDDTAVHGLQLHVMP
ncbi:hypothetical protein Pla163_01270 [Planctomycetes bacterium Pla163]|uniref:Uncharacterized protein n=1 Tax=Rohdeia mirabilis TaxID=2528008 RepID=A0A518CUZ2_9BACT|nr:hypothetical protein Pla163_01270 [Planctomycetes bacterium Pla163]